MVAMTDLLSRRTFLRGVAATAGAAAVAAQTHGARATGDDLAQITEVRIHPAVGIARVGNSRDAFHFAPEVPGRGPDGPFKDAEGAMAKQAARFRLYGYDRDGRVVREITSDDADIAWEIVVGNNKAAWYRVKEPLDLPNAPLVTRRNAAVGDRAMLRVTSSVVTVTGAAARPKALEGSFDGTSIRLAEVLSDERGRLVVMPGAGRAYSLAGAPPVAGYADNDGWVDDTCDGPVVATVRIGGRTLQAEAAHVVCTSPNYAPAVGAALVTAYDVAMSSLVEAKRIRRPRTDVYRDVLPILERLTDMQWVNAGFLERYGFGSDRDWTTAAMQRRLTDASAANRPFREQVLELFRNPRFSRVQPHREPQIYGDRVTMPPNLVEPRQWAAITPLQHRHLREWAAGRFAADPAERQRRRATRLDDLALADRPGALDRAALDSCLGGPFHPGVELPWTIRVAATWSPRLRLAHSSRTPDTRDYGAGLTRAQALADGGPLFQVGPGDIVKWMGVPWHADSASCRYGYQRISPELPGFWPARIPNAVLTEADYDIVVDTDRPLDERRAAFARRQQWQRFIARPTQTPTLALMIDEWHKLGVIATRPGASDGAFPKRLKVETGVGYESEPAIDNPAWLTAPQLPTFPAVIANSDDNTLRSIDASGNMTILTLSAPIARPEGITRDKAGNLYVSGLDGTVVQRVTPAGVVSDYATGLEDPFGVHMGPRGELYITNYLRSTRDGWLVVVSSGGIQTTLVPRGTGLVNPIDVVLSPDGRTLFVSNRGNNSVSKVDAQTGRVIEAQWLRNIFGASGLVIDARRELYVVARGVDMVYRYTLEGERLPLRLEGPRLDGAMSIAVDPHNDLYVTSADIDVVHRIRVRRGVGRVTVVSDRMNNPGGIVFNG